MKRGNLETDTYIGKGLHKHRYRHLQAKERGLEQIPHKEPTLPAL